MFQPLPQNKTAGRIASTNTTNELAEAVRGLGQIDHGQGSNSRGLFQDARVRVLAAAAGGGKYTGVFLNTPTNAPSLTGNLSDADAGVETGACVIFNRQERGQSTHSLTSVDNSVTDFEGTIINYMGDGRAVVEVSAVAQKLCP